MLLKRPQHDGLKTKPLISAGKELEKAGFGNGTKYEKKMGKKR